jgi:hypothetical protein
MIKRHGLDTNGARADGDGKNGDGNPQAHA